MDIIDTDILPENRKPMDIPEIHEDFDDEDDLEETDDYSCYR